MTLESKGIREIGSSDEGRVGTLVTKLDGAYGTDLPRDEGTVLGRTGRQYRGPSRTNRVVLVQTE